MNLVRGSDSGAASPPPIPSSFRFNADAAPFIPVRQQQMAASKEQRTTNNATGSSYEWNRNSIQESKQFRRSFAHGCTSTCLSEGKESSETLRVRLAEQLENETYECMICCDRVRIQHWIWSCQSCFHIFHLRCIKKWAVKSMEAEGIWRCPGCQFVNGKVPGDYRCFCGKVPNPRPRRGEDTPHSCGQSCRKDRIGSCKHKCTLPCHPGPCPPCPRNVTVKCDCGAEQKTVRCGSADVYKCQKQCGQVLNCEIHKCLVVCHSGPCKPCFESIRLDCFCGKSSKDVSCTVSNRELSAYSCGQICGKTLVCGNHICEKICHSDVCDPVCPWDPVVLKTCPCGKTLLSQLTGSVRRSCLDPVEVCKNICDKVLGCGATDGAHRCKSFCHVGECPPCPEMISMRCRCGANSKLIACSQAKQFNDTNPLLCERRCKKQRSCQLHRCGNVCCVEKEHICMQICGRPLNCGIHSCDQLCHRGKCPPCLQASFDELFCECGHSVLHPPVSCGAKPPPCDMPCSRDHPCGHSVTHNCHSESQCPPCTFLTKKWCYGQHERRGNIPCYLDDVSCGKACGKRLPCGMHFCMKICHPGQCLADGERCKYACVKEREECGHPCKAQCHQGSCPETPCKTLVSVTCKCGLQKGEMTCVELQKYWNRNLAVKAMSAGNSSDIGDLQSVEKYKSLACTEECGRVERNRRLADALNIENADVHAELNNVEPIYTDFLKGFWKENSTFVLSVEKLFVDLAQTAHNAKGGSKSHVFDSSGRDRRRFVHEYAGYFNMQTISYDTEPQRNVVVTANKYFTRCTTLCIRQMLAFL